MDKKTKQYWKNRVVLITGASSGIGWSLVHELASCQVRFCLLSRRKEKMEELARDLSSSGSEFLIQKCDVQNRKEVFSCVEKCVEHFGKIDIAWINSGISLYSGYSEWNWSAVEDMIDTNLKGAIYTTKACLDVMVPNKSGTIVGIGSIASMAGMPGRGIYCATKIGLHYFLESLACELPQIQFSILHPGFIETPINKDNPNRFFVMPVEKACQLMIKKVAKNKKVFIFPWQMRWLYRLVQILPSSLFRFLAGKNKALSRPGTRQIRK